MNKLLRQMVIYPNLLLLIVILCVMGYYEYFAEENLLDEKMKSIKLAFEAIAQKDLSEVEEEEGEFMINELSES